MPVSPVVVNVPGLATIQLAAPAGALLTLGYTQNGAQITFEGYELRVPSDEHGGDDGPPADIQYLGQSARVRLEMTKFDPSVSDTVLGRMPGATPGTPISSATPIGSLLVGAGLYFRLLINTPTRPYNFPCACLMRTPQEINSGTKFQRHILEAECYDFVGGVLWNRSIS